MHGQRNGSEKFSVSIRIGERYRVNDVAWAYPVAVEGVDEKRADMHGIDSWQALMLAVSLTRSKVYWPDDPALELPRRNIFWEDGLRSPVQLRTLA